MIDYDFYVNSYLGSAIPEKAFSAVAARAADALLGFTRQYQVSCKDGVSEKMALCAMADAIYQHKRDGLTSATVGGVSVRYENGELNRKLLRQARIYLDIYRGATPCSVH